MDGGATGGTNIDIRLHEKQSAAIQTAATELLFGGAAGGGKSLCMRAAAVMWCGEIPGLQVYLFRRLRDDLVKNHIEGPKGFRTLLNPWRANGYVEIVEDEIRFWNGSKIYLCHCKDEKDRYKYLGAEIHVLLIDELTTFTEVIYQFLRSRVRMVGITLPEQYAGRFPRIFASSNPGNVGHHWVKAAFIEPRQPFEIAQMPAEHGGMLRQFIPARLEDNPSLMEEDPTYGEKLEGLGNPALVRAMREGDWNVVAGAFFPEFETAKHVVSPRDLPLYWHRFRSFDWGSARPFSVHWWAVSDGELLAFPRGALICYREVYGAPKDGDGRSKPNTGLRLTAEEVAARIKHEERNDITGLNKIMGGVADPSIFAEDGGPSIASRMAAAPHRVYFRPADNKRVGVRGAMGGWDQLRARLKGDGQRPGIYWFSSCLDTIRTLPALQADEDRPEDCDTDGEDHAADSIRYACLSRPYTAPLPAGEEPQKDRYARRWRPSGRGKGSPWAA
jgi:Terminase large subunit, T4likevirus-type, N-terminal